MSSNKDNINSPKHYTRDERVEVIDLTAHLNFARGSIIKYAYRAGTKAAGTDIEIEDMLKIQKYAEFEIRRLRGQPISDTLREFVRHSSLESPDIDRTPIVERVHQSTLHAASKKGNDHGE